MAQEKWHIQEYFKVQITNNYDDNKESILTLSAYIYNFGFILTLMLAIGINKGFGRNLLKILK